MIQCMYKIFSNYVKKEKYIEKEYIIIIFYIYILRIIIIINLYRKLYINIDRRVNLYACTQCIDEIAKCMLSTSVRRSHPVYTG